MYLGKSLEAFSTTKGPIAKASRTTSNKPKEPRGDITVYDPSPLAVRSMIKQRLQPQRWLSSNHKLCLT